MIRQSLTIAALAALAVANAAPVTAGGSCCCPAPCVAPRAPMMMYRPYEIPPVYIVNQGPVYSGPGIHTQPEIVVLQPMPAYPYVRYDYPVYRDTHVVPMPHYWHHRQVRAAPRRTLRRPPGWFDK